MKRERFRKLFPSLAKEMECGSSKVQMDDLEDTSRQTAMNTSRKWAGYNPNVIDFIRRCETLEQAEEVIGYMEGRGEVDPRHADELRQQLREKGLTSFGIRKAEGFYHRAR
jgi:hypothetical protein